MRKYKGLIVILLIIGFAIATPYIYKRYQQYQNFNVPAGTPPSKDELKKVASTKKKTEPKKDSKSKAILGLNTADVREDTSSVQFLNLFKSAIPFNETIPWGSNKDVEFDKDGWPTKLNGGKAGTKFLNRLPEGTVEDGFFTVLYDGEGEIFYGNDARLIVHRPNKDVIEIKAGKDKILNASLFIKKTTADNYIRNIRILPEGGVCEGTPDIRVKQAEQCGSKTFLSFEEHHQSLSEDKEANKNALLFNPDYLHFMKDFQVVRYMNMSGMTRNPVVEWSDRNTQDKATWGGKYGSRGAPVELMVALSNQIKSDPWFSMPFKASDNYIRKFAKYVKENLDPNLKVYIEYSNEVWNPIFIHHDYAIENGVEAGLDENKSHAGYKWYSRRSVETFKIWEDVFGGQERLIRTLGSWASNQNMSSQILSFEDAYKHTDAIAIGPYVSAHPTVLRKAKNVDDVFKAMMDKKSKWGMQSIISYIQKQGKVASSYGVDLVAYEGGQHLVDWDTRTADQDPNPLLYAANRDPRMGVIYDELLREWRRHGGKLFVAFSAPRIYSWYGSWGIKEHIRQPRSEAPKYDSLLRFLDRTMHPEKAEENTPSSLTREEQGRIPVHYAKAPYQIWDMSKQRPILSKSDVTSISDISANWQANWDSKHLYMSLAITDENIIKGDEITLTLDASFLQEKIEVSKKETDSKTNTENETESSTDNENSAKTEKDKETKPEKEEAVKTFTFTPFDSLGSQTHITKTDTGYMLNASIPWSELPIFNERNVRTNDRLGINIKVTDVDEDEKGSQSVYLTEGNHPLPEIEFKHRAD